MSFWGKLKERLLSGATAVVLPEAQPTAFKVGDLAGHSIGDGAVLIELTEVNGAKITAKVVVLGNFYSAANLTGESNTTRGFTLGEALTFSRESQDNWNISYPDDKPCHILTCINNAKHFENYR